MDDRDRRPPPAVERPHVMGVQFSDVDSSADTGALVRYLDRAGEKLRDRKRASYAFLGLKAGDAVLDVGCGPGSDVFELEAVVGQSGRAVGVDSSTTMIAEARRRAAAQGSRAEFHVAPAEALGLADASFDGVRTERVLMHVEDPAKVVREMARVTRSGGRVMAIEPDHQMSALDASDGMLADRIFRGLATTRSARVGRALRSLFLAAGLVEVEARITPVVITSWSEFRTISGFAEDPEATVAMAAAGGIASPEEVRALLADLEAREAEARFFGCLVAVRCTGVRPA
jgi:SAM-dependent methyltransferase